MNSGFSRKNRSIRNPLPGTLSFALAVLLSISGTAAWAGTAETQSAHDHNEAVSPPSPSPSPVLPEPSATPAADHQRQEGHVSKSATGDTEVVDLLRAGIKRFQEGDYQSAEKLFGRALMLDPRNCNAIFNLGAIDEKYGNLPGALRKYELALSLSPDDRELQKAVDSVKEMLAARSAQEAREQAEKEYQTASQQSKSDHQKSAALHGSAVSKGERPVVTVPVRSYAPYAASVKLNNEQQPSKARAVARTAAAVGLMVGVGVMVGRGGGLGALHCPLCRLLGSH